jgi:uncharacterized protein YbjT (DUF2867 family)
MSTILVTGGTGTLGAPTVARLREADHDVRTLSRKSGSGLVTGDLNTGAGLAQALDGAATVLHLATSSRRGDVAATRNLIEAARQARVEHFVFISIVGVDDIPFGYYRDKVESERLIVESSVPYTILRATQFHSFVADLFAAQRRVPVILAPTFSVQPIAVDEVAERLVELAEKDPAGRVADIGGPTVRTLRDLAHAWARATGSKRPIWPLKLPGKTFAAYAAGHGLVPGPAYGRGRFEDYLAGRYGVGR